MIEKCFSFSSGGFLLFFSGFKYEHSGRLLEYPFFYEVIDELYI
jgi:hypothetical protein